MNERLPHRYIDLFAGCGGLALGLHEAGWDGLFAIERDPMAFETFAKNLLEPDAPYRSFSRWPKWLPRENLPIDAMLVGGSGAYRDRVASLRGSVGLVAGGPPCQGFSVGGIRNGADTRNELIIRMLEFVEIVQPHLVFFENVEGIARKFVSKPGSISIPGSVADYVADRLRLAGYDAGYITVDASRFGVPQTRRRVFIIGLHDNLHRGSSAINYFSIALERARLDMLKGLKLLSNVPVTVREAIGDLSGKARVVCPDSPAFMAGTYVKSRSQYATLMRRGLPDSATPDSHRFSKHGERITALYEAAHLTQPRGRLSKDFLRSWGTKKEKKVLLDPAQPASTITTHPDEFIHYSEPRNITVREMARLQSFPDDFHFYGRYTINGPRRRHDVARCSQVGNAVPPLLARAAGLALRDLLDAARGGRLTSIQPEPESSSLREDCAQLEVLAGIR